MDNNEKKLKRKEEKWVSNFQKHAFLSDGGVDRDKQDSSSPAKQKPSLRSDRKRKGDEGSQTKPLDRKTTRCVCNDNAVSTEDLVMLGLYRFTEEQEEIYRNFVQMLSGFDEFDRVSFASVLAAAIYRLIEPVAF